MAKWEDYVKSCVDESSSYTSYDDIPSRVDMNVVITWLKLVGEARADSF